MTSSGDRPEKIGERHLQCEMRVLASVQPSGEDPRVMIEDFMRALARVQSDYNFYVGCQTDPAVALQDYSLSSDERQTLLDPEKLARALDEGAGASRPRAFKITISGKHDWINPSRPKKIDIADDTAEREAKVAHEVQAIKQASTHEERTAAAVRLMSLIG